MKKKEAGGMRVFWFTLGISLFILLTAAGLTVVDYQGRRLSFGDSTPPFHVVDRSDGRTELELKLFGWEKRLDITKIDEMWDFLCDFSCIPHN